MTFVQGAAGNEAVAAGALARWQDSGARWVVLHRAHATADEEARARAALFAAGAAAVEVTADHELYALGAVER